MCGRFTLRTPANILIERFALLPGFDLAPRYNIAPTQPILALRQPAATGPREPVMLRWGLVPPWVEEPGSGPNLINARSEGCASKPSFRKAFRERRCLIIADGFYEWQKSGSQKQPFHLRLRDESPFAFAGLWERWQRGNAAPIESCTILTTTANDLTRPIHDRMQVILPAESYDQWLDPSESSPDRLEPLLRPYPAELMETVPVSTRVNSVRNDDPGCLEPAEPQDRQNELF